MRSTKEPADKKLCMQNLDVHLPKTIPPNRKKKIKLTRLLLDERFDGWNDEFKVIHEAPKVGVLLRGLARTILPPLTDNENGKGVVASKRNNNLS